MKANQKAKNKMTKNSKLMQHTFIYKTTRLNNYTDQQKHDPSIQMYNAWVAMIYFFRCIWFRYLGQSIR